MDAFSYRSSIEVSQFQLSQQGVTLKVLEAYTRDVGRGVARLDYDAMDRLDASTGDVIELKGKRRTVGKCLPLYPSDEGRGVIRIDGLIRNNSGVAIGDTVTIKKIKAHRLKRSLSRPWRPSLQLMKGIWPMHSRAFPSQRETTS